MRRKSLVFFMFLGAALLLLGLAALLTPHLDGNNVGLALVRFVVLCLAAASGFGTWATAVVIVSVHKKTWLLYVTVGLLLLAGAAFAAACYQKG